MVFLFAADISGLYDQKVYDAFYQKLPAWRKAKADRIKKEDGKVQCVGAWALWQKAQEELGVSEDHLPESEEEFLSLPYVNLSHSGKYVLCAVDHENDTRGWCKCVMVGCDIEKIGPLRLAIAKRNFCQEEYEHIVSAGSEAEQTDLFYRYWVLKESYIKATREGIRRPMNSFRTVWKDGEAYMTVESDADLQEASLQNEQDNKKFYYKEYRLNNEYQVAVCATEDQFSDEIKVYFFNHM